MTRAALPAEHREEVERAARCFVEGRSGDGRAILGPMLVGGGGRKGVCWGLAEALERHGRGDLGLSFAQAATKFDARDPMLWSYVAHLAHEARRPQDAATARASGRVARALAPILSECARLERALDDGGALAAAQRALSIAPIDADLWMTAGKLLRRLGRHDESLEALDAAARHDELGQIKIDAVAERAGTLYARGDVDEALEAYAVFDAARVARYGAATSLLRTHDLVERRARTLREACEVHGTRYVVLGASEPMTVPAPRYQPAWDRDVATLEPSPEIGVAELSGAEVWSEAAVVTVGDDLVLPCPSLCPRMRQDNVPIYTGFTRSDHTLIRRPREVTARLDRAVLVAGRGAANYFHFLLELLPRVLFAEALDDDASIPLLINGDMPAQHLEALEHLAPGRRRVVLDKDARVQVGRLLAPTLGGFIPDDPRVPYPRMMIAPATVAALRARLMPAASEPARKVALVRRSTRRRCLNEPEILAALERRGFELVDPLELGFEAQRALFSSASQVVMTCGAAQTNVVWMPAGSRLVVLWGQSVRPSYFSELGRAAGVETVFVRGAQVPGSHVDPLHRDFEVSLDDVFIALGEAPRPTSEHPKRGAKRAKKRRKVRTSKSRRRRAAG